MSARGGHQEVLMAEGWMSFILNLKLPLLAFGCGTLTSLVAAPDTYVTILRKDNVILSPKSLHNWCPIKFSNNAKDHVDWL